MERPTKIKVICIITIIVAVLDIVLNCGDYLFNGSGIIINQGESLVNGSGGLYIIFIGLAISLLQLVAGITGLMKKVNVGFCVNIGIINLVVNIAFGLYTALPTLAMLDGGISVVIGTVIGLLMGSLIQILYLIFFINFKNSLKYNDTANY